MKKIVLALGAAVIALTALQSTDAQAGGKRHHGWYKPYWKHYHYGHNRHYGPKCFWKKKKFYGHHGWYWKKYRVCVPYYGYY